MLTQNLERDTTEKVGDKEMIPFCCARKQTAARGFMRDRTHPRPDCLHGIIFRSSSLMVVVLERTRLVVSGGIGGDFSRHSIPSFSATL